MASRSGGIDTSIAAAARPQEGDASYVVHASEYKAKNGPSSSGEAVGLALIQMASMWGLKSNYVIAGALDLRGRVRRVRGLAAKAEIAQKENITSMLYPEEGQVEALMEALDSPGLIVMKPRISLHTIWWR